MKDTINQKLASAKRKVVDELNNHTAGTFLVWREFLLRVEL